MLRAFCDRCSEPCESNHSGSRRNGSIFYTADGSPLGLEIVPLFNGQVLTTGHICDKCFTGMIAGFIKKDIDDVDVLKTEIENLNQKNSALIVQLEQDAIQIENSNRSVAQTSNSLMRRKIEQKEKEINDIWQKKFNKLKDDAKTQAIKMEREFDIKLSQELQKQETALATAWTANINQLRVEWSRKSA